VSLKAFHVFFIAVCLLLAAGFGAWGIRDYRGTGTVVSLYLGVGSFAACIVLAAYGVWFLRKLRNIRFV